MDTAIGIIGLVIYGGITIALLVLTIQVWNADQ